MITENDTPKIQLAIEGWDYDYECGIVSFVHKDKPLIIRATPFWEDCEGIPVEVATFDGDELIDQYTIDFDGSLDNYIDVMKKELAIIYSAIQYKLAKIEQIDIVSAAKERRIKESNELNDMG